MSEVQSNQNTHQKFTHPVPIVNFKHKYNVLWNAKCGSALATLIFLEHCGFDCDSFSSNASVARPDREGILSHPDHINECRLAYYTHYGIDHNTYKLHVQNREFKNFKLVRNPFNRVISGYTMFMRDALLRSESPLDFMPHALEIASKQHPTNLSFLDFCKTLATLDIGMCNIHFMQQTHPLETSGEITIDKILRLEEFETSIQGLNEEFGFSLDYARNAQRVFEHHRPIKKGFPSVQNVSRLSYADYAEKPTHNSAFYCDETRELVETIYALDLANYNYAYPY